jgi:hypothetical protein
MLLQPAIEITLQLLATGDSWRAITPRTWGASAS